MSLIHPWMGWLALLAVIPVILHWLMRPQPKKLLFPALRLIQIRKKQNTRRLRMRHLALLLLRIGVILGIVFTLARPRVPSAIYLPTNLEWTLLIGILLTAVVTYTLLSRSRSGSIQQQSSRSQRNLIAISTVAAILIFALIVWPLQARIRSDDPNKAPHISANVPVAAALVFDTSLSMDYKHQGKTRLDLSRDIAINHINALPRGSQLALADTSTSGQLRFTPDLSTITTRISRLETHTSSQPLDEKLLAAVESHQAAIAALENGENPNPDSPTLDEFVREIYLFTDLSRGAWSDHQTQQLAEKLKATPQIGLYIIDVSSESIINNSLNDLILSDSRIPPGGEVRLALQVNTASKTPIETQLSLYLQSVEAGSELVKQEQISIQTSEASPATAEFLLKNLQGTIRQGEIRIGTSDPLQFDDIQRFTIEILPQVKMLVVSDVKRDSEYWINALAPGELVRQGRSSIVCDWRPSRSFRSKPLDEYSAITLLNVKSLTNEDWIALQGFVELGGGLTVILGKEVDAAAYFTPKAAIEILPGELFGHATFNPPQFLDLEPGLAHPLLKKFSERQITTIDNAEIKRYWRVKPLDNSSTIIRYTDDKLTPALLERNVGKGRVLLFTTGVSRQGWNELPVSGWYFVALADQMARYLAQRTVGDINYSAGQSVLLPLPEKADERSFLLRKPAGQQVPVNAPIEQTTLLLNDLDQLGSYRLISAARESTFEKGFTINYEPRESDLTPLPDTELETRLGKDRYRIVRSIEELDRTVRTGRIGVEALPEFFTLLVLIFVGELALSNLFYREDQQDHASQTRPKAAA